MASHINILRSRGAELFVLGKERVELRRAMQTLHEIGVRRLMVEGGGTLNFHLLREGLVDELNLFVAPRVFGGSSAPTLADGEGLPPDQAIHLERTHVEAWEDGALLIRYRVQYGIMG